ncbi:peptide ABC transporter substrate-binding protein [Frigoribacterium faeni]|uniref:peptide ABC transporter substrate-binding protein n=1 Tax=Frigoribacterium faeni TaxID=145483 RepID=UPI00141A81C7|nr:ABC transporter substrate-binding protein [Frigoribacterium faeni]NIJ06123.1 ABC-type transport system substrate-binding protein [Frigoribacterium faeni]
MRATRTTLTVTAVALLAVVLGGCAAGGDAAGDDGGSSFVYATGEPDHLTPGRQTVAFTQVQSLFAPLVSVDADNEITYVQAESVESDDNVTWTVSLRDGWTFQDDSPVTAQSYVDAWNYTATAANAFENSGQLAAVVGYDELNPVEGEPTATELSGLAVVDDTTFTVQLSHADSQFPLQLSQGQTAFYPMPESAYDDMDAYDRQPVGNGPYEMTEPWVDDAEFTVARWDDYQGDDAAEVERITYRSYSDQNTAYTDVLAGNADVLFLPASKMTSAEADFGDRLWSFDAPGIDYLGFPLTDERYSDVRVRQAISMSIDRDAVNEAVYGGLYEPATAFTPSAMEGTPEGLCGEFCEFDPDAAQELLAEAGGFDGTMEIVYPGGSGLDSLFEAYANQIRQNLGVDDVVAKPSTDWAEYYQGLVDRTTAGPHFGHWGALYVSQQNTLRSLFTEAGGCYDCTWYSSPEVDSLLDQADQAATPEEATDAYRAVQERVLEDFPVAPTFSDKYSYVTSEKIATMPQSAGSPIVQGITLK